MISTCSKKQTILLALADLARDHLRCMTEARQFRTGEEARNARAIFHRLARMDASEQIAVRSETCTHERLRDALRNRYQNLIGVHPEQRQQFRSELQQLHNVTIDELLAMFERE